MIMRKLESAFYKAESTPGGFLSDLDMRVHDLPIKDRPYELRAELKYYSKILGRVICVPARYRTDFASVPRLFWSLIPPFGRYQRAAVIHDWLCDLKGATGIDSKTAHRIFFEAMLIVGVPPMKARLIYNAVRWFGPRFEAASSQNA